ncbi:BTAD domain-containing putative transcriptional regulator [Streptomyces syringium]|uniref:DNA-binding SARP family transcriptional activator n=1 Tax=Streptomyces syringium TaxID=76729 RepID=A0ABS4YD72_9ACTN|nr:BTAD domain-containing putative transcriptional regulator [Streptomyces syringium]MBP2406742.1 DNA-binding SARP family transcriptional activator [Streptomyces syringium]
MQFQVLGPLSITDGCDSVVLQPSKPTVLLATLLLRHNSVVSTEFLQSAIWGEDQPASAKAALQNCVLRLRRIFLKYGIANALIESVPGGYRISIGTAALDLMRFRQLLDSADAAGDPDTELRALKEALALWQGPFLSNVPSDVLRRDEIPHLVEERLRAVERARDIELSLGRCQQVITELWTVARAYPARERFREQLIEALYRSGRQAEALAEYRAVKGYLREELGVSPGSSLQRLEMTILRGGDIGPPVPDDRGALEGPAVAAAAAGLPPAEVPPAPPKARAALTAAPPPTARPIAPVPHFTGRTAETASLVTRLTTGASRPVTVVLSGAPGIGKTALAQHIALLTRDAFPGGRFLVPMSHPDGTPRSPGEIASALARREHHRADDAPDHGAGRLLVLDDVTDAEQVRPLLPTRPGSAVIITSGLGLAGLVAAHGGWAHRLDTLTEEESCRLLAAVLGTERAEAEPDALRLLAAGCGHFPLALTIMAARLLTRPRLRVADCAAWLRDDPVTRLSLAGDPRLSVPRVFATALDRLDPLLADAFLAIGRCDRRRFTARLGARLLGVAPQEAEETLERLVDAGLLEEEPAGEYQMHELLRAFARARPGGGGPTAVPAATAAASP